MVTGDYLGYRELPWLLILIFTMVTGSYHGYPGLPCLLGVTMVTEGYHCYWRLLGVTGGYHGYIKIKHDNPHKIMAASWLGTRSEHLK